MSQLFIDDTLVRRLVSSQFPQWSALPVRRVELGGWDNRSFRLGDQMLLRFPTAEDYAAQVEKEHRWLPRLAPSLPLEIPMPLAIGKPADGYPWEWSVYRWIEGDTAALECIPDPHNFARSLAQFLIALQGIDATEGPRPGRHNFYRGGSLHTYDAETKRAIIILNGEVDASVATEVWNAALTTHWSFAPVWIHGDISAGNLLLRSGRLSAVIDFGLLAVGDPACDLAIAWTLLSGESRETFRAMIPLGSGTWDRGRGWALWKALIIAAGLYETNSFEARQCWGVITKVLEEHGVGA